MSNFCEVQHKLYDQIIVPNYAPAQVILVKGKATRNRKQQGKAFVDFAEKIAVNNQGHCHPYLVDALYRDSKKVAMVLS